MTVDESLYGNQMKTITLATDTTGGTSREGVLPLQEETEFLNEKKFCLCWTGGDSRSEKKHIIVRMAANVLAVRPMSHLRFSRAILSREFSRATKSQV